MDQSSTLNFIVFRESFNGYQLKPDVSYSSRYVHRVSVEDERRCNDCWEKEGTIIPVEEDPIEFFDHPNCRCFTEIMKAIKAGTATVDGTNGADYTRLYTNKLPDHYVLYDTALALGWRKVSYRLWDIIPGASVYDMHFNKKGKLPNAPGRIWYEADINYHGTKQRNSQRLLYSNDGLIFVSYDHYDTYFEIVQ